jgi:isoamylase
MIRFVQDLTRLRAENAIFRRAGFRDEVVLRWLNPAGGDQEEEHWDDDLARAIALFMVCPEATEGFSEALVLFNASENGVSFTLPERTEGQAWTVQVRTEDEGGDPQDGAVILGPRSLMVLA